MAFLNPVALALAALAAPIVALYFLKLRREERPVSSTYLWRTLVRDAAANAPWQRLRPNLLLFLQLLALALLVLALARPFTWTAAASGDHLILIVDTSASMAATDETPSRLAAAVGEARRLVDGLPPGARVTLIASGSRAPDVEAADFAGATGAGGGRTSVLVSGATDRGEAHAALAGLRPSAGGSDLSAAANLAAAVAARERDPEIVILSDGNVTVPARFSLPGRVRFIPTGRENGAAANQAITAFSLRFAAGGRSLSAFLQVENFGAEAVRRRLVLLPVPPSPETVLAARNLELPPGRPVPLTFDDLPAGLDAVEARLEGGDALSLDDAAWAVSPSRSAVRIDLVGPGNRFLETALSLLPGLEITTVRPEDYHPAACPAGQQDCRPADLTIFDGSFLSGGFGANLSATPPASAAAPALGLPAGPLLILAPIGATQFFSVTGVLAAPLPLPARADEPLLRYVDVRAVAVQEAAEIPLPAWARPILVAANHSCPTSEPGGRPPSGPSPSAAACPLLFAGETGGRRLAVLAFDLRKSDLPLRVAFPLLLANLLDYLNAGAGAAGLPESVRPGAPVPIVAPPGADSVVVTRPDSVVERLPAPSGRAAFADTDQPGLYSIDFAGSAAGQTARFAVNLFDPVESSLAVKDSLPLAGAGDASGTARAGRETRREWWRLLAWLALAALAAEWLYAHRGQLARLVSVMSSKL